MAKLILPVFLIVFFVYGCGEEEQPLPPDLIVRSLTIDGEATLGQPVNYTVLVANIGAGTARDFIVETYGGKDADDLSNNIDEYTVPELEPDKTHTQTLSFTPTGDSFSYIIAKVNADKRITEVREDNNIRSAHIDFHYDDSNDEREGVALIPAGDFEMGDALDEGYK